MKKVLKIGAVILGVLLIGALVIFIFFPGLPTYFKVKKEFPEIENKLTEFTKFDSSSAEIPDNYVEASYDGVTLMGPSYALNTDTTGMVPFKSDDNLLVMIIKSEGNTAEYGGEYDKYEKEDYEHLFESLDIDMPESSYDNRCFLYNLQAKDCLKLRGKDLDVFMELAQAKQIVSKVETAYLYEDNGNKGFMCDIAVNDNYIYRYNADFFTENNEYIISVFGNNIETINNIISSIEITED